MKIEINVARQIPERVGMQFGPFYTHHFLASAEVSQDEALVLLNEMREKFPEPAFKCGLSQVVEYRISIPS